METRASNFWFEIEREQREVPNQLIIYNDQGGKKRLGEGKRTLERRRTKSEKQHNIDNASQRHPRVNIHTMKMNVREETSHFFSANESTTLFPHSASRLSGASFFYEPSKLWMHVLMYKNGQLGSSKAPQGFSFPLCGFRGVTKAKQVVHVVCQQMKIFTNYIGNQDIIKSIEHPWHKAKVLH